jgi:urease accessory protein
VDGDRIVLDVEVDRGACALLGTQASTKVYRCPVTGCSQETRIRIGADALLALVPDPVVCFAGARYAQSIVLDLAPTATVVLVDAFTAGRSACGERWDFRRYSSQTTIRRDGEVVLRDSVLLDPAHGVLRQRMGRFDAIATVILLGPLASPLSQSAAAHVPPASVKAALLGSVGPIADAQGTLARIAGTSAESTSRAVRALLVGLPQVLGDNPWARKW